MKPLQSQPTVSPTLIHHIQRNEIKIKPNIKQINGNQVTFDNGQVDEFDHIILCTGYKIGLEFIDKYLRSKIFTNKAETNLQVIFLSFILKTNLME
jgi:dimethylaniline monooxygenase (N-oxide forming)